MAANLPELSGGQLVVAALRAHGVEMAFSVAGESYLEVLDALYDAPEIRLVTCRQEGGAAFMAEAYGKLTGKPGVLLVTRGPGACNASIGVHTAHQDSTPMVVLVGQVARHQIDREAFQEVDFRKMYAPLAKWVTQIDMAERVPELLNQAFQVATSGRPGPVVVALPEDMLRERAAAAVVGPYRAVRAHPGAADLAEMRRLLAARRRGRSCWSAAAAGPIRLAPISPDFAMANDLPVCCSFRRQDIVDNRLPCFVGDLGTGAAPALVARDKIGRSGARGRRADRRDHVAILHAAGHPRSRQGSDPRPSLRRGAGPRVPPDPGDPVRHAGIRRRARRARPDRRSRAGATGGRSARAEYEAGLTPSLLPGQPLPALDLGQIMVWLRERLPDDAIVTSRRRQFQRLAEPLSAIPPPRTAARADQRRDGLRRAGRGRGQARPSRTGSSSGSAATAAS